MTGQHVTRTDALYAVRNVARVLGYAIAEHGSRSRDLDLLAVPWTEEADTAEQLVQCVCSSLDLIPDPRPVKKPHGRKGWALHRRAVLGIDAWYIDLSVMPRRRAPRVAT